MYNNDILCKNIHKIKHEMIIIAVLLVLCIFVSSFKYFAAITEAAQKFSVSKGNIVIQVGKKMSIKYTAPGKVKVSSSRKKIAKAEIRKKFIVINAKKAGKAVIKVKWKRKTCKVKVTVKAISEQYSKNKPAATSVNVPDKTMFPKSNVCCKTTTPYKDSDKPGTKTENPSSTEVPNCTEPTKHPAATPSPKPTEMPVVTPTPEPTKTPVVTPVPESTKIPEVTTAPESTDMMKYINDKY